jgi:uncharacterized membrane protein
MITVQEVFNQFYGDFAKANTISPQQSKAARDIMQCRTPEMGGHLYECDECGYNTILYNSCRNRHCGLCQNLSRLMWSDERANDVLDAPYFHVVFTLPKEMHHLVYQNQERIYPLMYKAVAETLAELSGSSKYLGAQIGFFSMLHTWGQDLRYHPHIHTVVLAGGLSKINTWKTTGKKFFIPVKVLAKKFRGKMLHDLRAYHRQSLLEFYGEAAVLKDAVAFNELINTCYRNNWYTYTKKTFSSPLAVIRYLSRYTHRVAIASERILSMNERNVTISVRDRSTKNKKGTVTMTGTEFVRRFLKHILPKGFVKIRYYGIMANRNKKTKLVLCRKLSKSSHYKAKFTGLTAIEVAKKIMRKDFTICPCCLFGCMKKSMSFPKGAFP